MLDPHMHPHTHAGAQGKNTKSKFQSYSEHAPGLISSRGSRDSFWNLACDKCALGECVCVCVVTFVAITTPKVSASQRMDGANDAEVGL